MDISPMTPEAQPWKRACAGKSFKRLKSHRTKLVVALLAIYLFGYLGLSTLAGFGRGTLGIKVLGPLNLGYALILGNYVVAWTLALIYVRVAGDQHDSLAVDAIAEHVAMAVGASPSGEPLAA